MKTIYIIYSEYIEIKPGAFAGGPSMVILDSKYSSGYIGFYDLKMAEYFCNEYTGRNNIKIFPIDINDLGNSKYPLKCDKIHNILIFENINEIEKWNNDKINYQGKIINYIYEK